jgi:hypothetical protein
LSTTTASPWSIAARASGTCAALGAATTTRSSASARAHTSSALATISAPGCSRRACSARSGSRVTTVVTVNAGAAASSGPWKTAPASPYPTIAARSSLIAPS